MDLTDLSKMDPSVVKLMETVMFGEGDTKERIRRCAQTLLQLKLNNLYPRKINATDFVSAPFSNALQAMKWQRDFHSSDTEGDVKGNRIVHLLKLRTAARAKYGDSVAVISYDGGPGVEYAFLTRMGPDSVEQSHLRPEEEVNVTRIAVQPMHPKIKQPLWVLRFENAEEGEWNPALNKILGPWHGRPAPDPRDASDASFKHMMSVLATYVREGWQIEEGDYILREHMQRGTFAVNRERAPSEEIMDVRSFSCLLWKVANASKEGLATYADGRKVLDRIKEAGLRPRYFDFVGLMDVASGAAQNGTASRVEVEEVLDLMAAEGCPPMHWVYMAAYEALGWAGRHAQANLGDAAALWRRMCAEQAAVSGRTRVPHWRVLSSDPDLWAAMQAAVAGAAHCGVRDEALMEAGAEADGGGDALSWTDFGASLLDRMLESDVQRTPMVYHAFMEVVSGAARQGEAGAEEIEEALACLLQEKHQLTHDHAYSLLAAVGNAAEHGNARLEDAHRIVAYMTSCGLEIDPLAYSLWVRVAGVALRRGQTGAGDLLELLRVAQSLNLQCSDAWFDFVSEVVADAVRSGVASEQDLTALIRQLLLVGRPPSLALFNLQLELAAQRAERGEPVRPFEVECVLEDLVVAGHRPDTRSIECALQAVALACEEGRGSVDDAVRIVDKAFASAARGSARILELLMVACLGAAQHAQLSLQDAERLLARAETLGARADEATLCRLLAVGGAAAQHGLATVEEAERVVERLEVMECKVTASVRAELVQVLAGAARWELATMEDAERVLQRMDRAGERPTQAVLSVLLDVVVSEARYGRAGPKDADNVLSRMRGCGFLPEPSHHRSMLAVLAGAAREGLEPLKTLADAERALAEIEAGGAEAEASDLVAVLETASWTACWSAEGGGEDGAPTEAMRRLLAAAGRRQLGLGVLGATACARIARYAGSSEAVVKAWDLFRTTAPKARTAALYSEMMGALFEIGNTEAAVGLLEVAAKHRLRPSPDMLDVALDACKKDAAQVPKLHAWLGSLTPHVVPEAVHAAVADLASHVRPSGADGSHPLAPEPPAVLEQEEEQGSLPPLRVDASGKRDSAAAAPSKARKRPGQPHAPP